jgi:tripartite-type tricarboxylate transporter receptor subunit TctC
MSFPSTSQKLIMKKFIFFCVLLFSHLASAQSWPNRPVKIIVPFSAGGNTDSIARITADEFTKIFGQPFIVENKPGANGAIATNFVAQAPADGYTLLLAVLPQMAVLPAMTKTAYDPVKDFSLISIIASNEFALSVANNFPANNLKEFVQHIQARPDQIAYASAGNGTLSHLTTELFNNRANLKMLHVPYKGGAPAIADVMGEQVPMYFANIAEANQPFKGGKVKVIATTGLKRNALFPQVPTIAESGYPGFRTSTWNGLAAPKGTPPEIIDKSYKALKNLSKNPEFVKRMQNLGVDVVCNTPEEFNQELKQDLITWAQAVKLTGATVN